MTKPHFTFWIIAVLLLLWGLMGVGTYISQMTMDLDALARTDPYQAEMFRSMPPWVATAYALAVGLGTLGSVLLLLRKVKAIWVFVTSLLAVVVQFSWSLGATDLIAVKGWSAATFPTTIVLIGVFAVWYSRYAGKKGWLR